MAAPDTRFVGDQRQTPSARQASAESARSRLRDAKAWIFDMDGVLYRGDEPLAGVGDLLNALDLRERTYMLATNNSMSTAGPVRHQTRRDGHRRCARIDPYLGDGHPRLSRRDPARGRGYLRRRHAGAAGADFPRHLLSSGAIRRGGARRGRRRPRQDLHLRETLGGERGDPGRGALRRHQRRRDAADRGGSHSRRRQYRHRDRDRLRRRRRPSSANPSR